MRRVVITGLGMVTPLACGVEETWSRLIAGKSGAGVVESFDVSDLACKVACEVPRGDGTDGSFNPDQWMEPKEQKRVDDFIIYAMAAASQAVEDSGWKPEDEEDQIRTGVMIGSGIGGLRGIAETALLLAEKGPRRISPFFIPGRLINLASGYVSIKYGLKGPNHSVVTACSTGAHAIGDASRLIALGDAEVMVAGGTESASTASAWPASSPAVPCRPGSTTSRPAHRDPMTATGTDLSWARAQAWWFSKNSGMPRPVAPGFMPKSPVTGFRATPITLPHRPRTAMAASGR